MTTKTRILTAIIGYLEALTKSHADQTDKHARATEYAKAGEDQVLAGVYQGLVGYFGALSRNPQPLEKFLDEYAPTKPQQRLEWKQGEEEGTLLGYPKGWPTMTVCCIDNYRGEYTLSSAFVPDDMEPTESAISGSIQACKDRAEHWFQQFLDRIEALDSTP